MLIVNKHWTIFTNLYPPSMGQARVHPRGGGLQSVAIRHNLRGRRLKGKGKGVLRKGVLGARETRGARPNSLSPFPFERLPRRLHPSLPDLPHPLKSLVVYHL